LDESHQLTVRWVLCVTGGTLLVAAVGDLFPRGLNRYAAALGLLLVVLAFTVGCSS
jgi:hypothetical protein